MGPWYQDDDVTVWHGDCLDVLADMPDSSVDAVVTDPPYGLEFMGKDWDAPWKSADNSVHAQARNLRADEMNVESKRPYLAAGVNKFVAGLPFQNWCQTWATECLRVLKPGGHMLAFGGTRTWHRLTVAIEDAGFEIRDTVADLTGIDGPALLWQYGSGFPKSLDVSKAIDRQAGAQRERYDRPAFGDTFSDDNGTTYGTAITDQPITPEAAQWQGWGTALKPSWEPIVVARKPLAGTVAGNVLQYGTGGLNIDASRIHTAGSEGKPYTVKRLKPGATLEKTGGNWRPDNDTDLPWEAGREYQGQTQDGRWPPNAVLGPAAATQLDQQSGNSVSRAGGSTGTNALGVMNDDSWQARDLPRGGFDDQGGASRFFPVFRYEAKAPTNERPRSDDAASHPTVKPLDLIRWLVTLVTPPGGTILDPFAGSGTTGEAAIIEGFKAILIEREGDYLPMIRARLSKPIQPVLA